MFRLEDSFTAYFTLKTAQQHTRVCMLYYYYILIFLLVYLLAGVRQCGMTCY